MLFINIKKAGKEIYSLFVGVISSKIVVDIPDEVKKVELYCCFWGGILFSQGPATYTQLKYIVGNINVCKTEYTLIYSPMKDTIINSPAEDIQTSIQKQPNRLFLEQNHTYETKDTLQVI